MTTRAETIRLRNAGRLPAETVAYLQSKGNDGVLTYPPDRWMRWLAEFVMLFLLYEVLSSRPVSLGFKVFSLYVAWTVWRSVYKLVQLAYRKSREGSAFTS
jgi:hypothetical protein